MTRMASRSFPPTNLAHLEEHDQLLVRLGMLAENYFTDDPNTCILKLRQFGETSRSMSRRVSGYYVRRGVPV